MQTDHIWIVDLQDWIYGSLLSQCRSTDQPQLDVNIDVNSLVFQLQLPFEFLNTYTYLMAQGFEIQSQDSESLATSWI